MDWYIYDMEVFAKDWLMVAKRFESNDYAKANLFCKWFEYITGLKNDREAVKYEY